LSITLQLDLQILELKDELVEYHVDEYLGEVLKAIDNASDLDIR